MFSLTFCSRGGRPNLLCTFHMWLSNPAMSGELKPPQDSWLAHLKACCFTLRYGSAAGSPWWTEFMCAIHVLNTSWNVPEDQSPHKGHRIQVSPILTPWVTVEVCRWSWDPTLRFACSWIRWPCASAWGFRTWLTDEDRTSWPLDAIFSGCGSIDDLVVIVRKIFGVLVVTSLKDNWSLGTLVIEWELVNKCWPF